MVNAIESRVPEPIRYKGHGQLESASPSSSVGHVVLHELRHVHEFHARAEQERRAILHEDVDIQFAFVDGQLVAIAGRATAVMGPPGSAETHDVPAAASRRKEALPPQDSSPRGDDRTHSIHFDGDTFSTRIARTGQTDNNVEAKLREIKQEKEQLQAQGVSAAAGSGDASGDSQAVRDALKLRELERREAQLEIEHQQLHHREAMREAGLPENVTQTLLDAVLKSSQVAGKFAAARYGGGEGEGENPLLNLLV